MFNYMTHFSFALENKSYIELLFRRYVLFTSIKLLLIALRKGKNFNFIQRLFF